ncbi:MAG: ECF transporter S component [Candidatus Bathyarchaeia archaeon]
MIENIHTSKGIALIAVFAALHTILSSLPFTITIGVSGSITLGVVSAPLIGIILGPISGGISVLIGSVIGMFINPSGAVFGFLSFLPATIGALSAGFMITKRGYISAAMLTTAILAFYAHPYGREAIVYPFMHIIAVVVALLFSTKLAVWSTDLSNIKKLSIGIPIAAFVGTLSDHIVGSSLAIWMFDLQAEIWNSIIFIYPVERIVAVVLTVAIALPLYYSLRRSGIFNLIK